MTDASPALKALTEKLLTLEAAMAHMRELALVREQMNTKEIEELKGHNRIQDQEAKELAKTLGEKIEQIHATLWSGLKWLGGLLATTLLSVVLKTLGLV
jgi:hypothetical protein